jgi:uncharacterized membrane protein
MRQRYGITESVWQSLPARSQRSWRFALLVAAMLAAPFAGETGRWGLDAAIGVMAVTVAQLAVEAQRRLSRLGNVLSRERVIRIMVGTCRIALLALGCTFFLGIAAIAADVLVRPELLVALSTRRFPALTANLGLIFVATVTGRALFKVFRDTGIERFIWHLPAAPLRRVFVERRYVAASFPELILLELIAHIAIFGYCMTASRFVGLLAGWTPPG